MEEETIKEFEWSFVGAVLIISLACIAILVSVTYYCWLYEVLTLFSRIITSLFKNKTQGNIFNKDMEDPAGSHTRDLYSASAECDEKHEKECHVVLQPRNTARQPLRAGTKLSPRIYTATKVSGTKRQPARHVRQTRQRAVNKALHALKSDRYHRASIATRDTNSTRPVPCKPEKSEVVRAYLKGTSDSEGSSGRNTETGAGSGEEESEPDQCSRDTGYSGDITEIDDQERLENSKQFCEVQSTPPSFRSQKWSKMEHLKSAVLKTSAAVHVFQSAAGIGSPLPHKIGRSARAVAPQHLTKHHMYPYVRRVIELNNVDGKGPNKTNQDKTESIFEILLALRKSADLGMNLIDNPVSKPLPTTSNGAGSLHVKKEVLVSDTSSRSDEIKSSSTSISDSNNASSEKSTAIAVPTQVSNKPDPEPEFKPGRAVSISSLDPSQQVFGANVHENKDVPVRRIDGLFCSSSSAGSNISENIFTSQVEYNNCAPILSVEHMSGEQTEKIGGLGTGVDDRNTNPNQPDQPDHTRSQFAFPEVDTSSFASTSLPSVSSTSSSCSSTLDLSSEQENINNGKLNYFGL